MKARGGIYKLFGMPISYFYLDAIGQYPQGRKGQIIVDLDTTPKANVSVPLRHSHPLTGDCGRNNRCVGKGPAVPAAMCT